MSWLIRYDVGNVGDVGDDDCDGNVAHQAEVISVLACLYVFDECFIGLGNHCRILVTLCAFFLHSNFHSASVFVCVCVRYIQIYTQVLAHSHLRPPHTHTKEKPERIRHFSFYSIFMVAALIFGVASKFCAALNGVYEIEHKKKQSRPTQLRDEALCALLHFTFFLAGERATQRQNNNNYVQSNSTDKK